MRIAGWAIDTAAGGPGVDAVHVWAYPLLGETPGTPQFLAAAVLGVERPDIVAKHGAQFLTAGFESRSPSNLPPGAYLIVA